MLPKNVNVPCKFPFTYQGKEYHKCTKKDNNKEWCAMDMSHHLSNNGPDCKACWKNETYKWGVCDHNTCELGEQLNNNFKKLNFLQKINLLDGNKEPMGHQEPGK